MPIGPSISHPAEPASRASGRSPNPITVTVIKIGTIRFNRDKQPSLLCAVLRPGNAGAALGPVTILERLLEKIRVAFPKARIRVCLDGSFGNPTLLDYLDGAGAWGTSWDWGTGRL